MTPDTMVIDEIESRHNRGREMLSARIRTDQGYSRLWVRWNGTGCPLPGDAFLLAAIQPAMQMRRHLTIRHAVSASLLDDIPTLQQHLQKVNPGLPTINIAVEADRPLTTPTITSSSSVPFSE